MCVCCTDKKKKKNGVGNRASCHILLDVLFLSTSAPETGSCGNNEFLKSVVCDPFLLEAIFIILFEGLNDCPIGLGV